MKICLIEPFYAGSHKSWADNLVKFSAHEVRLLTLPGRHWKWRMHGGAVSLAEKFLSEDYAPDLILATDMVDLSVFLSLTRSKSNGIPTAIYFHENQLTYPWSPTDADVEKKRDNHYAFINYTSALSADHVFFNSDYHRESFVNALPIFLEQFPDEKSLSTVDKIKAKSSVLPLGIDLKKFDDCKKEKNNLPKHILWNHRWEYDKNPDPFFELLINLSKEGYDFKLSVVGQSYSNSPAVFNSVKNELGKHLTHFGFLKRVEDYASVLKMATILPVTSNQDFFGGSVVEAIYSGAYPLLPNRLAYPAHIPTELHTDHLYETAKELELKLRQLLNPEYKLCTNESLVNFVNRYDWTEVGGDYDQAFQNIIS